jgi:hypothetical protein
MKYEIFTDEETQTAFVTVCGEATFDGFMEVYEALAPDGHFTVSKRLWDLRDATVNMTSAALERLGHEGQARDNALSSRVAVVATRDVDFGLARVNEIHRASGNTRITVFRDFDEALEWLEE